MITGEFQVSAQYGNYAVIGAFKISYLPFFKTLPGYVILSFVLITQSQLVFSNMLHAKRLWRVVSLEGVAVLFGVGCTVDRQNITFKLGDIPDSVANLK